MVKIILSGEFNAKNSEEIALITSASGCSGRDVLWAEQCHWPDISYVRTSTEFIKGRKRVAIIFKVDRNLSTIAINEATSMDGWYFRKDASGNWDYRK